MAASLNIRHYDPTVSKRKKRKGLQQMSVGKLSRQEASVPAVTRSSPMASSRDIDARNQSDSARSPTCLQTPNQKATLAGVEYVASPVMAGEAGLSTEHAEGDVQSALSFDLLSPYYEIDDSIPSRGPESMSWPGMTTMQDPAPSTWRVPDAQYYVAPPTFCQTQPGPQDVAEVPSMQHPISSYRIEDLYAKEGPDVIASSNGSQSVGAANGLGMPARWPSAPHSYNISAVTNNSSRSTKVTSPQADTTASPFVENGAISNDTYSTAAFAGMRADPCESCEILRAALLVALSAPTPIQTGGLFNIWQGSSQSNSPKRDYSEEEQSASARSKGVHENVGCCFPGETMADAADTNMPSKRPRSQIEILLHPKKDAGIDSKRERTQSNSLDRASRRSSQCRQLSPLSERRLRAREREGNSGTWVSSHANSVQPKTSQSQARNMTHTSSHRQRRKEGRRCGVCGIIGHNSRTCPDG